MKNVDLIIFDLDGTLIDSKNAIVQSIVATLKYFKLPNKPSHEISSYIGKGVEELLKKSTMVQDATLLKEIESYYVHDIRQHANSRSRLYPHIETILEHFKHKQKIILTNRRHVMALHALDHFHIAHHFVDIIGGDNHIYLKPSPYLIERVMHRYNVLNKQTIIIGDMAIDIIAGKNAHILTCAYTGGIGTIKDIKNACPDFIIDDMIQLKNIIV